MEESSRRNFWFEKIGDIRVTVGENKFGDLKTMIPDNLQIVIIN